MHHPADRGRLEASGAQRTVLGPHRAVEAPPARAVRDADAVRAPVVVRDDVRDDVARPRRDLAPGGDGQVVLLATDGLVAGVRAVEEVEVIGRKGRVRPIGRISRRAQASAVALRAHAGLAVARRAARLVPAQAGLALAARRSCWSSNIVRQVSESRISLASYPPSCTSRNRTVTRTVLPSTIGHTTPSRGGPTPGRFHLGSPPTSWLSSCTGCSSRRASTNRRSSSRWCHHTRRTQTCRSAPRWCTGNTCPDLCEGRKWSSDDSTSNLPARTPSA